MSTPISSTPISSTPISSTQVSRTPVSRPRVPHASRRRRGASATEFALILPVLVLIFGAVIELSLYISTLHRVSRVARDAARVGSVIIEGPDPTGDRIEAAARQQAREALDGAGLTCRGGCEVEAAWVLDEDSGYRFVTVHVRYPYRGLTGLMPLLRDNDLQASFSMLTQQQ